MKQKLFTLLLAVAASVGIIFAESGTCGNNLTWDLTNGTLTISGTGAMTDYDWLSVAPWSYSSSITSVVINEGVTSIGDYAFSDCSSLTSATIGSSVTSIGDYAFSQCSSLTSVTIPNSVTSIGEWAFGYCSSLTSVTIPNNVTSIGSSAFSDCSSLTSVTIGSSVTSIGDYAFSQCSGLTSVTIPNSVTSIGTCAFGYCRSLTSVTIPNSVISIGEDAFYYCEKLTSVTIPNSVTSIGEAAFDGCPLENIILPASLKTIGEYAFYCGMFDDDNYVFISSIKTITCYSMLPPSVEGPVFPEEMPDSTPVYVPADYLSNYTADDFWGQYDIRPLGATSIETTDVQASNGRVKVMRDGQVLIIAPDGRVFNTLGAEVK